MPIKTPETPQFNKAERISSRMYDAADEIGVEQPELHQTFSQAANEFATENYDKGQRVLEKKGTWNDKVRGAASEANQASREKNGAKPLTFDEAKDAINGYAKRLAESGELEDKKDAALIESIVSGMNRPGMDGMDEALEYIEGVLQTKSNLEQHMHPQMKKDWEEQRAVRDALFAEKQKRMEKLKQTQRAGEGLSNDRNRTSETMEELYTTAGVPEDTPSRQGLLRRVKSMSPEEMHFLNAELGNIARKFKEAGDPKDLDAALFDLTTKEFTKEEVHERQKKKDTEDLDRVRNVLNVDDKPADKLPEDRRGLVRYFKENFGQLGKAPLDEFRKGFTPDVENKFQGWVQQHLSMMIKETSPYTRSADTVANIFGNAPGILQRIASLKEGKIVDYNELLGMPFSQVAKKYFNIDLPEDYFNYFYEKKNNL